MSINKKIIVAALMGIAFGASSCKKYLDVNKNPNYVTVPTVQTLLPAAELYVGTGLGVDLEIDGSFYGQFWTQSPGASQYEVLNKYIPGQDQFSTPWTNLYAAAENFNQLYNLADSQKSKQYMAVALLMEAYTFQLITDGWGDVPCTQALHGQYADGHVVNPKYDAQDSVYTTIIGLIDSANVLLDPTASLPTGNGDLIYNGNMAEWQKFSNTLALRVYMRLSQVAPTEAAAGIAALYANPNTSIFIGTGDDAFIGYGANSANNNPLYADAVGLQFTENYVASATCLDTMLAENDPRTNVFYEPAVGVGSFVALPEGLYNSIPYTGYSYPSVFVGGDAQNAGAVGTYNSGNAPVNFLTSYESLFLQAEASARGWANPGNDATLFLAGISANFTYYSAQFTAATGTDGPTNYAAYIAAGGAWTNYPATGTIAQKVQYIITQKWFAMSGNQGFEAWTEWRRTGYPNWFTYSASNASGINTFPKRFLYPTSESTVNSSYPGLAPLTSRVWWDVQAGTDH